ncbi:U-box domain-containing protein 9, partial [Tanacetum coccineum]
MFSGRKSKTPLERGCTSNIRYPGMARTLEHSLETLELERHALVTPTNFCCPYNGILMKDPVLVSTGVFDTTPSDHDSPSVNFIFSPSHHDYNYDWHSSHHENAIESEGQHAFLRTETDSPRRLFYRLFSATPTEDQKVAAKSLRKLSQNKSDANTFFSGGNMTNLNKIVWALVRGDLIPGVEKELVATVHNVCVNVDASRIVENTPELYTALARGLQSQNQNTKENSLLALFRVVAASEENLISFYNQGLLETLLNFYDNNKESARFGETVVRITRNLFNFKPIRESALRSELIGDLTTKLIERVQLEPVTEILLS